MKELRLAGLCTIEAANAWLPPFIAAHNARFGREPANPKDLHRKLTAADDLGEILTWQEERTVTRNLTLHYDRMMLILEPTSFARVNAGRSIQPALTAVLHTQPDRGLGVALAGATATSAIPASKLRATSVWPRRNRGNCDVHYRGLISLLWCGGCDLLQSLQHRRCHHRAIVVLVIYHAIRRA